MKTTVEKVPIAELKLLELNARFMPHEVYARLVENVKKDGELTGVVLVAKDEDGHWEVISGNHRVMAARDAGLTEVWAMKIHDPLPKVERIARQLSQNEIVGKDDPVILKQLYEMIEDVDWKLYSGLDDKTLTLLAKVDLSGLSEAPLEFQMITMMFLPSELKEVEAAWKQAKDLVTAEQVWLASIKEYDAFMDALEMAGASYDVKNVTTSLMLVLKVFENHVRDLKEGWLAKEGTKHGKFVPIATVFGTDKVPAKVAYRLNVALKKMVENGELEEHKEYEAFEKWVSEWEKRSN